MLIKINTACVRLLAKMQRKPFQFRAHINSERNPQQYEQGIRRNGNLLRSSFRHRGHRSHHP